jgi:hypothetical protein
MESPMESGQSPTLYGEQDSLLSKSTISMIFVKKHEKLGNCVDRGLTVAENQAEMSSTGSSSPARESSPIISIPIEMRIKTVLRCRKTLKAAVGIAVVFSIVLISFALPGGKSRQLPVNYSKEYEETAKFTCRIIAQISILAALFLYTYQKIGVY